MRSRRILAAAAAAIALAAVSCRANPHGESPPALDSGAVEPKATQLARADAGRFLERYARPDGRVVRIDQGGDTVSEGQAYALLLAAAVGDAKTFESVWRWTQRHLERSDGLFSWHWAGGHVLDPQPAADADLDLAWALALAADRFARSVYRTASTQIARAILSEETAGSGEDLVLVAGPWARSGRVVNPSYLVTQAMRSLARTTGDDRWQTLARSSSRALDALTDPDPHLPPDWAKIDADGSIDPAGAPGTTDPPRYGYDAVRVPLFAAASCAEEDRIVARRMWPFLSRAGSVAAVSSLDGRPIESSPSAPAFVGAAGAAFASGKRAEAATLLDRAERTNEGTPTYYGSALIALGRVLLETTMLVAC